MKKIKIRFVSKISNGELYYEIQRKTIFGWRYYSFYISFYAYAYSGRYKGKVKQELLKTILNKVYKTELKYVEVIEYPMIKIY